jgi:hypothetical protein
VSYMARIWITRSDGVVQRVSVKSRGGYRPVSGRDVGGGAKKVTRIVGGKRRRVRLWEKKPEGKVVRYTRTFLFEEPVGRGGGLTPTTKADVIVEDIEPFDITDQEIEKKLKSEGMRTRMEKILFDSDEFKGKFGGELPRFKAWGGTEVKATKTVNVGFVDDFRAWTKGG